MNNIFKTFILLIIFNCSVLVDIKASHIMGGEMTYQYIGFNSITGMEKYRFVYFFTGM